MISKMLIRNSIPIIPRHLLIVSSWSPERDEATFWMEEIMHQQFGMVDTP